MSRQCQCGGILRAHPLTESREAWTCNSCGRYDAINRLPSPQAKEISSNQTQVEVNNERR